MRQRRNAREPEVDPFYDMLFNMLIAFVFCFIVALLAMNPKTSKAGDVVWFRNREAGLMVLDRDDRGESNNSVIVNGKRIVTQFRQEVVTIRGVVPGEYVVNAHYYESKDVQASDPKAGQPVDVTLTVVKVNPRAEVVFNGQHRLVKRGDEATLVRFSVRADGSVGSINTLPARLVERL